MKEKDAYAELSSIRELMERSSKFISLSGLSGVLAGIYALIGARFAVRIIDNLTDVNTGQPKADDAAFIGPLLILAITVLVLSILTAVWLSMRKAKKRNEPIWNPVSRRLLAAISIPLITGGLFISILVMQREYAFIPAACLIFYGLALVAGSPYTFNDIKWLGIGEILLGLLALTFTHYMYGLMLWAMGFGLLHIIYGTIMHFKYER